MAKKMQKLFAMLLIGTVTLSATSLSALAVEYDISSGAVHVEADESGTNKSWQEGHDTHNSKENGSTDKEIIITQINPKIATSNTVNVGENVRDVTITLDDVNIKANDRESAVTIGAGASANITVSGDNTLVGGVNGAGIAVSGDATLNLSGDGDGGTLTAIGNGGKDEKGTSGAGIGGTKENGTSGTINIDSLHGLTAEGYGEHAAGIGSAFNGSSGEITIKNSTIDKVAGGFVTSQLNDLCQASLSRNMAIMIRRAARPSAAAARAIPVAILLLTTPPFPMPTVVLRRLPSAAAAGRMSAISPSPIPS